ncbi:MAG: hypothetical protein WBC04_04840 [Candidatus Acidiferrales bacterium]
MQTYRVKLFLADEVAAAARAHSGGVDSSGQDVAPIARTKTLRLAVHGESHLAVEDDMSRFGWVRVLGVECVWAILPDVGVRETFEVKLAFEVFDVHRMFRSTPIMVSAMGRKSATGTAVAPRATNDSHADAKPFLT